MDFLNFVLITVYRIGVYEPFYLFSVLAVKRSLAGAVEPVAENDIALASRYYCIVAELYLKAVISRYKCTVFIAESYGVAYIHSVTHMGIVYYLIGHTQQVMCKGERIYS